MNTAAENDRARRGALILCGGGSRRMGRDKASVPFGDETMLARVMRLVADCVPREQFVLVAAADQHLPPLPWDAIVVRDRAADQGPLPALVDGLAALPTNVAAAFVTACDVPLLEPAFVGALFAALESAIDAAVPRDGERLYPLNAVYRPSCAATLRAYRDGGRSSLQGALRSPGMRLKELPVEQLRCVDPELRTLLSCNTPEEYQAALALLSNADRGV
ncbi:MAG: molybdenum cofactor guanylyltransferase [Planctomycetaceae bacterium]|nr:molybdenum cofactor guanylyltransferase [Planctomycetaceae bacterium]